MTLGASVLRRIEAMGVTATRRHWSFIPAKLAHRARTQVFRAGDGLATLITTSDSLRMNRVIGFGHRGAATAAHVAALIERYRAAGVKRFTVELGPSPQVAEIRAWLTGMGFQRHGGHVLLARSFREVVPAPGRGVSVTRARGRDLAHVIAILGESFAVPASRRQWSLTSARRGDGEHYLAFVGAHPAGVGALRIERDLAWLGAGATRTRWRRRGVHGAIIATRLRRAAALGCRWAWTETAAPRPGRPGGSRRNLMRFGFVDVCVKPIFLWQGR
jgi:hypothetical protein